MNKRSRFILILVVLAVCALFLRPSVKWYFGTPDEIQKVALSSLEKIKDESEKKAKKAYKAAKKDVPSDMNLAAVLSAFSSSSELQSVFENYYRSLYLKAKHNY